MRTPSAAAVIAALALFVARGGTGCAVTPVNVGGRDVSMLGIATPTLLTQVTRVSVRYRLPG